MALTLIMAVALSLTHETVAGLPFAFIAALLVSWVLYRYGLLALISAIFFLHLTIFYPITPDLLRGTLLISCWRCSAVSRSWVLVFIRHWQVSHFSATRFSRIIYKQHVRSIYP